MKISGWSLNIRTMRAARRVLPPDLMAPAMRSQPRSKEMGPEDRPLPLMGSLEDRRVDRLMPTPEPDAKIRPSVVRWSRISSMLSPTSVRKQAEHWGIFIRGLDREGFQIVLGPLGMVGLVAVACIAFPQVRASPAPLLPVADVEPDRGNWAPISAVPAWP